MSTFAAIDFETANYNADSACAVGVVVISDGRVVHRQERLIRPPSSEFIFTHIHGLTWSDVAAEPTFAEIWPELRALLKQVDFLAAHNASFDKRVLINTCASYGLVAPKNPFVCTMDLARNRWNIYPTRLPDVCRWLSISLNHHNALSDAEACANIVLAAEREGWRR
jgi:DNA polymerase-3 subunit epsilon